MPEEETKKILILQTSGVRQPRRTYAPLYIATAAAVMDMDVTVWFTMEGVSLLENGVAENIELVEGSGVTLKTWFDRARDAGVRFLACAQALEGEELNMADLIEDCDLAGAASIVDMSLEADQVFFF
ncbi:MAG: DsrE family protein [Thermoleophilia bacterium]|nr:DsrE family protein [Thermoleophilia bacterium]